MSPAVIRKRSSHGRPPWEGARVGAHPPPPLEFFLWGHILLKRGLFSMRVAAFLLMEAFLYLRSPFPPYGGRLLGGLPLPLANLYSTHQHDSIHSACFSLHIYVD